MVRWSSDRRMTASERLFRHPTRSATSECDRFPPARQRYQRMVLGHELILRVTGSSPFIGPSRHPAISRSRSLQRIPACTGSQYGPAVWGLVPRLRHFRDRDMVEVDIVLERGAGQIAGVEVKAAATVTAADFRGLRKLKEASGKRFAGGVVVYDGETSASFGDGLYAVPLRTLWEGA